MTPEQMGHAQAMLKERRSVLGWLEFLDDSPGAPYSAVKHNADIVFLRHDHLRPALRSRLEELENTLDAFGVEYRTKEGPNG